MPADADAADTAPSRKPPAARRSRRSAAQPAAVAPAATQADADTGAAGTAAAAAAAGTAAAPPGAALAAANAAVQEQWKHDVRFAPELTPRQVRLQHSRERSGLNCTCGSTSDCSHCMVSCLITFSCVGAGRGSGGAARAGCPGADAAQVQCRNGGVWLPAAAAHPGMWPYNSGLCFRCSLKACHVWHGACRLRMHRANTLPQHFAAELAGSHSSTAQHAGRGGHCFG
jgi:hypothetical protein